MPISVVCDACDASFTLKDDFAGRKVRCQVCQNVLLVPEPVYAVDESAPEVLASGSCEAFHRDRFFINQKKFTIGEKYTVLDEASRPVLFVERPAHLLRSLLAVFAFVAVALGGTILFVGIGIALGGDQPGQSSPLAGAVILGGIVVSIVSGIAALIALQPRRHITIYTDEAKTEPVLTITQDNKFSILKAWYTVHCPEDGQLGRLMKHYLYNIVRKRWFLYNAEGAHHLLAMEDSMILSLLRRFLGPLFGFLRTNFIIVEPGTERVIGEFNRKFSLFDKYVLDLSADRAHELDRRMGVALAVLLDTGERR